MNSFALIFIEMLFRTIMGFEPIAVSCCRPSTHRLILVVGGKYDRDSFRENRFKGTRILTQYHKQNILLIIVVKLEELFLYERRKPWGIARNNILFTIETFNIGTTEHNAKN